MKKIILLGMAVLALVVVVPVMACDGGLRAMEKGALWQLWDLAPAMQSAGNNHAVMSGETVGQPEHVLLAEKCPEGVCDWSKPENWGKAWGRLVYVSENSLNKQFSFDGYLLEQGTEYTLFTYGGWSKLDCLGTETADTSGYVNIKGTINQILTDEPDYGGKVWLVPSNRVNCTDGKMVSWAPSEFLFEEVGIPL